MAIPYFRATRRDVEFMAGITYTLGHGYSGRGCDGSMPFPVELDLNNDVRYGGGLDL